MNYHTQYIDNLKGKFEKDFNRFKQQFINDVDHLRTKFVEQETRNAQLKAENCLLSQKLVKKDKAILLLSEKDVEEKDTKIKKKNKRRREITEDNDTKRTRRRER